MRNFGLILIPVTGQPPDDDHQQKERDPDEQPSLQTCIGNFPALR
jgi:hypothetical protein